MPFTSCLIWATYRQAFGDAAHETTPAVAPALVRE
jgi:hypothetical protein